MLTPEHVVDAYLYTVMADYVDGTLVFIGKFLVNTQNPLLIQQYFQTEVLRYRSEIEHGNGTED